MIPREYMDAIVNSKVFSGGRSKLLIAIFEAAGAACVINEATVKTWLKPKGHKLFQVCTIKNYFPDKVIDEKGFIEFFSSYKSSWKKLQSAFCDKSTSDSKSLPRPIYCDSIVDIVTDNPNTFYRSLLNQFLQIFGLPDAIDQTEDTLPDSLEGEVDSQIEDKSGQMRDKFIETTDKYKIMDIINRSPAFMHWIDSARLNIFIDKIVAIITDYKQNCGNMTVFADIETFKKKLHLQAMSIERALGSRFTYEDESAFVNMEDEDDSSVSKKKQGQINFLRLSIESFPNVDADDEDKRTDGNMSEAKDDKYDTVALLELASSGWNSFRNEMNFLYNEICGKAKKESHRVGLS